MKPYDTPAEAAAATGASRPALRTYTNRYTRYFSTEATPEQGRARRFTAADLKVIAFIREKTITENLAHEEIEAHLAAGELERFAWEPPDQIEEQLLTEGGEQAGASLLCTTARSPGPAD